MAGCSADTKAPGHLQVVSMVPFQEATISITSVRDSLKTNNQTLSYAKPTGYIKLQPGKYRVAYAIKNNVVLDHLFVLGPKSYQSLLITGLYSDSMDVNPETTEYRLKKIVAGAEVTDPNGFLPQFIMLRDGYEGTPGSGLLRLVHAAPFKKKITVRDKRKSLVKKLSYPAHSDPISVSRVPELNILMGSVLLKRVTLSLKKRTLLTVILGESNTGDSTLVLSTYQTPTDTVRKKQ